MDIILQELTKRFPNRKKGEADVIAVDRFTLTVPDGRLVGLLGPSGCGKSTVLNLISGLLAPTAGRIFFGDDDMTHIPPERRDVGLVFQNYALYPHLTVRKNIRFPIENLKGPRKLTKEQMEERVQEAARVVQIEGLLDRKPDALSGGQQQRVAIARALVKNPKVLLLDEPLSNLDARLRLQTREELRRIQQETKFTTIFVTHDQEEAMSISDSIVVMDRGTIQQMGKPQDVYDDPANLFVAKFLGTPPINVLKGSVKDGVLLLGGAKVLDVPGARDGDVTVGVRPEGFDLDGNGPFSAPLLQVEVMGRDISVVCRTELSETGRLRAIIDAEHLSRANAPVARFTLSPRKVHLFDPETGKRIPFSKT